MLCYEAGRCLLLYGGEEEEEEATFDFDIPLGFLFG